MLKLAMFFALAAGAASAESAPDLMAVLGDLDGKEVQSVGVFEMRSLPEWPPRFTPDGSDYGIETTYALDRDTIAAVEDCATREGCRAEIKAETIVARGLVTLRLYDVAIID